MRIIKTYWEEKAFDIVKGWYKIRHEVNLEVADDATEEEINRRIAIADTIRIN